MRVSVGATASVSWLVLIGVSLHRILQDHSGPWCSATSLLSAVVAITSTIVLAIICTVPNAYEAWARGVDYGRRHRPPDARRAEVPHQKARSLHSV